MKRLLTLTALALLSFVACEKTSDVCEAPAVAKTTEFFPSLESSTYETLRVRRVQLADKLRVAKSLLYPHRSDSITVMRPIRRVSASEAIHYRDNPPE